MSVWRWTGRLIGDRETESLLRGMARHPGVFAGLRGSSFPKRLKDLLPLQAELVADVALAWARSLSSQGAGAAWGARSDFVDIALTLQRLGGGTRSKGLDVFELLLAKGVSAAEEALVALDPRVAGRWSGMRRNS